MPTRSPEPRSQTANTAGELVLVGTDDGNCKISNVSAKWQSATIRATDHQRKSSAMPIANKQDAREVERSLPTTLSATGTDVAVQACAPTVR